MLQKIPHEALHIALDIEKILSHMQPNGNYYLKTPTITPESTKPHVQIPVSVGPVPIEIEGTQVKPASRKQINSSAMHANN